MDFSKFDNRTGAEIPQKISVYDPFVPKDSGEKLIDGKSECRVLIKLPTAPSVEKARRALRKSRMAKKKDDEERDLGVINQEMIDDSMLLITGFENINHPDGHPLTDSDEDKRWFLNLVYPVMGVVKDEDGNTINQVEFNRDGDPVSTPKMEMKNYPFAFQIQNAASDLAQKLGNGKSG